MTFYESLALAAAQTNLNDVCIQLGSETVSLRTRWGLWLNKGSPTIGKPEANTNLVYVPGSDKVLNLTCALDGKVHYKQRTISMQLSVLRPKAQWATIRYEMETLLQGQWLRFWFTRDGELWDGLFDVELTPDENKATVSITATCDPFRKGLVDASTTAVLGQAVLGSMVLGNKSSEVNSISTQSSTEYQKQNFRDGDVLYADQLNHMEDGIANAAEYSAEKYTSAEGVEITVSNALKARLKKLVVTADVPFSNDATPNDIKSIGHPSGVTFQTASGTVTLDGSRKLHCVPAIWSSTGNMAINGKRYYVDSRDWTARKDTVQCGECVITGSESFSLVNGKAGFFYTTAALFYDMPYAGASSKPIGICSHYKGISFDNFNKYTTDYAMALSANSSGYVNLRFSDSRFGTVEEFKAYLTQQYEAGTPVTIAYALAKPYEREISQKEFELYDEFLVPSGDSAAKNGDGCSIQLEYWNSSPSKEYADFLYEMMSAKSGTGMLGMVTVEDFGAKGNGVSDDTAAFKAALATGKNVLCYGDSYLISDRLTIATDRQRLIGSGSTQVRFISSDEAKVGIDVIGGYTLISGIQFSGTGVGFCIRGCRKDASKFYTLWFPQFERLSINKFKYAVTSTAQMYEAGFREIRISNCAYGLHLPNTWPESKKTYGNVNLTFEHILIMETNCPYYFTFLQATFTDLNIGFNETMHCYSEYSSLMFITSKYESHVNHAAGKCITMGKNDQHTYISCKFSFATIAGAIGFSCGGSRGLTFISCVQDANSGLTDIVDFIDPESTFLAPRAVYYGPGCNTLPKVSSPEKQQNFVYFDSSSEIPEYDRTSDEGKVLKIIGGKPVWVNV